MLARSAHDPLVGIETLRALVASGAARLWVVTDGDDALVGAYVMTERKLQCGSEAVLVAAGADMRGVRLTRPVLTHIAAQYANCTRLRVNASRRGMARELERCGFTRQATTYVKSLAHVL